MKTNVSIYPSTYLSIFYLSIHLSIYLRRSIYVSISETM